MSKHIDLYAYYFPNWHQDRRNDIWHGKGWTEWEVLKCARPRFPGHNQPLVPLWGYEDEADPAVMDKKILCAKQYGIKGFIFDTYYYDDGPYRERCLDEGFLHAPNAKDFGFAILWCNHNAIYAHPSPRVGIAPMLKSGAVTEKDFVDITNDFIAKYFWRENYIRIDGKLLFAIYNVEKLVHELGGILECRRIFDDFRQRVRNKGLGEVHLCTVGAIMEDVFDDHADINRVLNELGIDENLRYWWPIKYKDARLTMDYWSFVEAGYEATKQDIADYDIPTAPHLMTGIDQSPRTIQSEIYENMNVYPWYAIVNNPSPIAFGNVFRKMHRLVSSGECKAHFITCVWNEWTEGNFLEPEKGYGYSYLEAIKNVLDEEENNND